MKKRIVLFALIFCLTLFLFSLKVALATNIDNDDSSNCPTSDELNALILKCKNSGLSYTTSYDEKQCKTVKCLKKPQPFVVEPIKTETAVESEKPTITTNVSCASEEQINAQIEKCKNSGLEYKVGYDERQCKYVKCLEKEQRQEQKIVGCKKIINVKGCVEITCEDGYRFNSCSYQSACRVDCKTYTDQNNCVVKTCSDGSEKRDCPKKEITCEVVKTDNGCEKKVCSDGYQAVSCPPVQANCKVYKDQDGCEVKECADGYKNRECPTRKQEKEVECKVYIDERNCKIKTCTNGLKIDYCAKPSCKVEKDNQGCEVKKCEDGVVSRNCPNKESIECLVIKDEQTGCTIKKCSNGYETKDCPTEKEIKELLEPTPTQEKPSSTSGGVFNAVKVFLNKIFSK